MILKRQLSDPFLAASVLAQACCSDHAGSLMRIRRHRDGAAAGVVAGALLLAIISNGLSATHYVDLNSARPTPPYTSWITAATTIQDAVDVADAGDLVLVTNGLYSTGGRAITGIVINRVAVTKPLMLQSVNGPQVTVIQGERSLPTNGYEAVRCVYLASGATLSGFTLTNGATVSRYGNDEDGKGGGVWAESTQALVSNCVIVGNSADDSGAGVYGATITGCEILNNISRYGGGGGGAYTSIVNNCTLSGNSAFAGGGAQSCTLSNCVLKGNSATLGGGGGAADGKLIRCRLDSNSAQTGGGASGCTLNTCFLTKNYAAYGGGANACTLNNCTITGNSARYGGGVYSSRLSNCIVWFNQGSDWVNYDPATAFEYCCTTPQPTAGTGNLSTDPQLVSDLHLSSSSPCRGAGNPFLATGPDFDGEPWASPPSIGCDEFYRPAPGSTLTVNFFTAHTNVAVGQSIDFAAQIEGVPATTIWSFGDSVVEGNKPWASHCWAAPGDYNVVLSAFDQGHFQVTSVTGTVHVVTRPVLYVCADSRTPMAPYDSWTTAATNIQDAVDAAAAVGALILVTNGVYDAGERVSHDGLTNRVVLSKPVTVQSVNGPLVTVIEGPELVGTRLVRCAYVASGAILSGFTLTKGVNRARPGYWEDCSGSDNGGGAWCEPLGILTNCIFTGNNSCLGGAVYGGKVYSCALIANEGWSGGGAADATLYGCTLESNSANYGGGAQGGTLYNCVLSGNSSGGWKSGGSGGGALGSMLYYCTVVSNYVAGGGIELAGHGGGTCWCAAHNCSLIGNTGPGSYGGGAYGGILYNCALWGNSAGVAGGGASDSTLYNCTLSGNSAPSAGGTDHSAAFNSIIFGNTATTAPNWSATDSNLAYCCTTPLPTNGVGNLDVDPQLASYSHLSSASPCRNAGNALYATGLDIDGEPWANPPSIGCDEYRVGKVTGPLSVRISVSLTNVVPNYPVVFEATIEGRTTLSVWDLGDGLLITNRQTVTHAWSTLGEHKIVLRVYNESNPTGVVATVTVWVGTGIYYVSAESTHPQPPYGSWAMAARDIQDAVDVANEPGAVVLVTNGLYATGGRVAIGTLTNRVAADKPIVVRSINGPQVTIIEGRQEPGTTDGDSAIRCVYLSQGASLSGFTLRNGATKGAEAGYPDQNGGGVFCYSTAGVVSNCFLIGNSAQYGGGAAYATLNNCVITGNSAQYGGAAHGSILTSCILTGNTALYGGGASGSSVTNCTLVYNWAAYEGGGAFQTWLYNSIVYFNTAAERDNYDVTCSLDHCCTTPQNTDTTGSITNEPFFMDRAAGNLRLQANSPCINSGSSLFPPAGLDLDGNPRVVGGTVDIGAYEFQGPVSLISSAWLQQYGLAIDGSEDWADPDHDGLNNWQEWRCGTNPTNGLSALRLLAPVVTATNVVVTWESVPGITYFLERCTNLVEVPIFEPVSWFIYGQPGTTSYVDPVPSCASVLYRVSVR